MLSDKEKQELIDGATAELTALTETVVGLREMNHAIPPDNAIGRLTRMDAINTRGANERALKQALTHQQQLKTAIDRIQHDPHYGLCEECDEMIPFGRLKLVPEATHCVDCA